MATKQQRDKASKRLTEVLIEASLADTDEKMNEILIETLWITKHLTINRIKKIKQDLINKAVENSMHVASARLEKMFPNIDMK